MGNFAVFYGLNAPETGVSKVDLSSIVPGTTTAYVDVVVTDGSLNIDIGLIGSPQESDKAAVLWAFLIVVLVGSRVPFLFRVTHRQHSQAS